MNLSAIKEEFLRNFFARQRDIGKEALENVTTLAKANIETIVTAGIQSPPTIEKMEEILKELKSGMIKKKEAEDRIKELVDEIQGLKQDGNEV